MHVQFELANGELVRSDEFDLVESGLDPASYDDAIQSIQETFEDWPQMGHLGLEVGGRKRYYNPAHVVWAELVF